MISTVLANIGQHDPILHVTSKDTKGDHQSEWISIRAIEDPYVQEVAKFAVREFEKEKMARSQYKRLLSCWIKEEMGGIKYRLILEVIKEEKIEGKYEAIVWEASGRLIIRKLKLISFMPCMHGVA
ncbi:Cystatin domain containing protein [Cucumis melo var. makuwa]|uniref:Cystatin domain containing protein n=2 Tax=Cucumis melo TaxID=3656 RepID=A0A5A7SN35_CUCMM|nr:Cystatin domain containing protein [Cucumis melo var. makuwa]TYK06887.1 Cystatin domain containing protein [Cucumis melo var. makuwa]